MVKHPAERKVLLDYLAAAGIQTTFVNPHADLLSHLHQSIANGRPPALLLLDGALPSSTNLTLVYKIRAIPELVKTPVVVLTTPFQRIDEQRALQVGVVQLSKPLRYDARMELLGGLTTQPPSRQAQTQPTEPPVAASSDEPADG